MGRKVDENFLDDKQLTSNSLGSQRASGIFDSAAKGNLQDLKQLVSNLPSLIARSSNRSGEKNGNKDLSSDDDCTLGLSLVRDEKNSTPLHYAAGNGHLEICRFILDTVSLENQERMRRSNSINVSANTTRSVYTASSYTNTPNKTQGRTALHWAARNGHLQVCKLLVEEYGANPDPLAKGDVTPLQLAVWRGHLDVCLWLSETGAANKHFMNGWGCTVHHWLAKSPIYAEERQKVQAEQQAHDTEKKKGKRHSSWTETATNAETKLLALCKWLDEEPKRSSKLPSHSAWNWPNDHGQTPLHKAGFGGNMPVLKFLVETKGCCDTHRDSQHNTAADCAERNRQWEAAKYLRRHGSPKCLQKASRTLFPDSKEPPREPSLPNVRAAYIKLARLYHPDRSIKSQWNHHEKISDNTVAEKNRWKDLQKAYRLWTIWWTDPDEADVMIRSLERHHFLQRQLPLLLLWHQRWHDTVSEDTQRQCDGEYEFKSNMEEGARYAVYQKSKGTLSLSSVNQGTCVRNAKKQKVGKNIERVHYALPSRQQFSDEAMQKLEDFERKLVRLLGTLPSHEIPLSQLPKEYEKTWGGYNTNGGNAMIRPRDYRCKKLGFLLEKHCSRTVELVKEEKERKAGITTIWVRLKRN